jgi:hypothetical protein
MYVIEYDGKGLFNPKQKKKAASTGQVETNLSAVGPASYQQHLSSTSMPGPSPAGKQHLSLQIELPDFCWFQFVVCGTWKP